MHNAVFKVFKWNCEQHLYGHTSPECYTTFCMMNIYSDTLLWSGITPMFDPITDLDLITEFDFLPNLIARGFHRTFATGAASQQRMLTPPDTWSCPTLGLASVLILRPISSELVLFLDFWVSNIPRYFCFCFLTMVYRIASTNVPLILRKGLCVLLFQKIFSLLSKCTVRHTFQSLDGIIT